jgi:hypothetical protein
MLDCYEIIKYTCLKNNLGLDVSNIIINFLIEEEKRKRNIVKIINECIRSTERDIYIEEKTEQQYRWDQSVWFNERVVETTIEWKKDIGPWYENLEVIRNTKVFIYTEDYLLKKLK